MKSWEPGGIPASSCNKKIPAVLQHQIIVIVSPFSVEVIVDTAFDPFLAKAKV